MDAARDLFDTLRRCKSRGEAGISAQQRLLDYCRRVLGPVERLHVDFKEKHDSGTPQLDGAEKQNLAKAVSGFANSAGGVLLWGIEDKTLEPKPITDIPTFVSQLLELATRVTDPVVQGIDGDWIPADSVEQGGFGILLIPESPLPPHRVILRGPDQDHYFVRTADSFVRATHVQLEDMFGRRPKPKLELHTRVTHQGKSSETCYGYVVVGIRNCGRGGARAPFLAVAVRAPYAVSQYGIDGNGHFGLPILTRAADSREHKYGSSGDVIVHPGMIHDVTAIQVEVRVSGGPASIQDLAIDYTIAAEGIEPVEGRAEVTGTQIWDALQG